MYGRIFSSLWDGSMRGRSDLQLVFIYLLCQCDSDGSVEVIQQKIADDTGLSIERVKSALQSLESDDPDSRTPDEDGRRLRRLDDHRDWGWSIINHEKYRALRNQEDRKNQNRESQRRKRASAAVSKRQQPSAKSAHTDVDVDVDSDADTKKRTLSSPDGDTYAAAFFQIWAKYPHYGRRSSKAKSAARWQALKPRPDSRTVLSGLQACTSSEDWTRDGGRFVPAMEVWIAKRGWDSSDGTEAGGEADPLARARYLLAEKEAQIGKDSR